MKKPNITPGPWSLQEKRKDGFWVDSILENAEPEEIALASTSAVPVKQARANATAIAALPDLLEALESALPMLVECNPQDPELWNNEEHCPKDHPNCCLACATFYKIRAALTKAGYTLE